MQKGRNTAKLQSDFIEQGVRLRDALAQDKAAFDALARAEGLQQRKAYYLINIADTFERSKIPRHDLLEVGWTKLEMLRDRARDADFPELFSKVKSLPVPELRRVLAGGEAREERHVVQLYLSAEQFEVLAEVVDMFGGARVGRTLHKREEALTRALKNLLEQKGKSL